MSAKDTGVVVEHFLDAVRRTYTREMTMLELAEYFRSLLLEISSPKEPEPKVKKSHIHKSGTG